MYGSKYARRAVIQAAQYESQTQALTDAGFGLQFSDISYAPGDEAYGSEIQVAKSTTSESPIPAPAEKTVTEAQAAPTMEPPAQAPSTAKSVPGIPIAESAPSPTVAPSESNDPSAETIQNLPAEDPAPAVLPAETSLETNIVAMTADEPAIADATEETPLPAEKTTIYFV